MRRDGRGYAAVVWHRWCSIDRAASVSAEKANVRKTDVCDPRQVAGSPFSGTVAVVPLSYGVACSTVPALGASAGKTNARKADVRDPRRVAGASFAGTENGAPFSPAFGAARLGRPAPAQENTMQERQREIYICDIHTTSKTI